MPPPTFDPTEFFDKTTYYPSSARADFRLVGDLPPVLVAGGTSSLDRTLRLGTELLKSGLMAFNVTLPPQTLATNDGFAYNGPTRKIPSHLVYSDLEVQFYLMGATREEAGALYRTMAYWHEHIAGYRKKNSAQRYEGGRGGSYTNTFHSLEYYDNYIAEAEVTLFHQTSPDVAVNKFHYYELYPLNIGSMLSDWSNQDQPMVLPMTFTYHYVNALDSDAMTSYGT